MADELTVEELLKRCMQRPPDEEAWAEFVRRYDHSIRLNVGKTFRSRVGQEADRRLQFPDDLVDDLVQAVYVRLIEEGNRALKHFTGQRENSIYQYLGIISINVVRDHFRGIKAFKRPKVTHSLDELFRSTGEQKVIGEAVSDISGNPRTGLIFDNRNDDIENALRKSVSRKNRDRDELIFKLHYYDGLTLEEIRKALRLELSAVGIASLLSRITERMRAKLFEPSKKPRDKP